MSFQSDLKLGEAAELLAAERLSKFFGEPVFKNPERDSKDYDLIGSTVTIEVKKDVMFKDTGNIAFEYECNGCPSGIKRTRASHWATVIGKCVYLASMQDVIHWLIEHAGEYRKVSGGDGGRAKMVLLTKDQFLEIFEAI